eukprot:5490535-Pyramimonas_sp.AAC.1
MSPSLRVRPTTRREIYKASSMDIVFGRLKLWNRTVWMYIAAMVFPATIPSARVYSDDLIEDSDLKMSELR